MKISFGRTDFSVDPTVSWPLNFIHKMRHSKVNLLTFALLVFLNIHFIKALILSHFFFSFFLSFFFLWFFFYNFSLFWKTPINKRTNLHPEHIQNPVKLLRCSVFRKKLETIFAKRSTKMMDSVLNTPLEMFVCFVLPCNT